MFVTGLCFYAGAQTISHSVCANDTRVKRYFVNNQVPGITYTWAISGGGTVIPSASDTLFVDWGNVPGIYRITSHGMLNGGCESDTGEYFIEILPAPIVDIQGNTNVCAGEKVTLTATDGGNQILWSNGDTDPGSDFFPTQPTTVWVVATDGTCPSDTAFLTITPVPLPVSAFTASPTEGEAPLTVNFSNQSSNGATYGWDFGNGKQGAGANPSTVYQTPGSYPVTLVTTNAAGCTDTSRFEFIVVNEAFTWFVPNTFTPTDDSRNEIFRPYFPTFVEYTLSIFDRWGNTVYQSTSVDGSWNGTKDSKPAPQDVYTYRISFRSPTDNKQHQKWGSVTLLR